MGELGYELCIGDSHSVGGLPRERQGLGQGFETKPGPSLRTQHNLNILIKISKWYMPRKTAPICVS